MKTMLAKDKCSQHGTSTMNQLNQSCNRLDADTALERGVEKKVKHVRRVALVCDNGGGIGHGPEGSAVTASMLLLLPVVLLLLWWRFDPSGEEEVGAVVRRAPR
eukprot:CAMPEP_0168587540 /NCGR_PEP_ID=MMETSP0420-20121227/4932_1 /TAXON_ID=498008 /ORGANISM="Pessonella sp." /LENGTH=103 /DNA_ID=CAMNT_0008622825 /DNA_START=456 /DNA_END=763 /DNA_ORIENTATION=+